MNAAVNVGSEASRTITDLAPYRESLCTKGITLHGAAQESRMVIIQAGYGGRMAIPDHQRRSAERPELRLWRG